MWVYLWALYKMCPLDVDWSEVWNFVVTFLILLSYSISAYFDLLPFSHSSISFLAIFSFVSSLLLDKISEAVLHRHLYQCHFILYLFIYLWLFWVFITAWALFFSCGAQGLLSSCRARASHCRGFPRCRAQASVVEARGLGSCSSWALEHRLRVVATGFIAPQHVGFFQIRDWTSAYCIRRQILCPLSHQGSAVCSFPFLVMLDLLCCVWAFSESGEQGYSLVEACGLLIAVASLVAEHRF